MKRLLQYCVIALLLIAVLSVAIAPTVDLPDGTPTTDVLLVVCLIVASLIVGSVRSLLLQHSAHDVVHGVVYLPLVCEQKVARALRC